jgi:hypothetical protein
MTTTCASCGSEVGDAPSCPSCGAAVLSPQTGPQPRTPSTWRTDTAERAALREAVEPASAPIPAPARYPLFADELDVAAHREPGQRAPAIYAPEPPAYLDDEEDADDRRGSPPWLVWAILAVVLVLVAFAGVWLLFSPSDGRSGPGTGETLSVPRASGGTDDSPSSSGPSSSGPATSEPAAPGEAVDVASSATAVAPRTAPPNADAFGNRTTYDAANMLDGLADTCWRMAGDGTGSELTFTLSSSTSITRVGLINGYAKNAFVGGHNLNWYLGNRRVLMAQWIFDDGSTIDQPLRATKQMQTIELSSPVTTSTIKLRLVSVSSPGGGRSARDYTAVSEVSLVGVPSA